MKTSSRQSALVLAVGLALTALPAAFANDSQDQAKKFQKLDTDGDGRVSSAEYTSAKEKKHWWNRSSSADASDEHSAEKFAMLDKDQDGFLTAAELDAGLNSSSGANSPTGRSSDYFPRDSSSSSSSSPANSTSGGVSGASNANGNGNATTSSSTGASDSRPGNSDGADKTK